MGLWRKSSGDDGEQEWTAMTVMTARIGEDWRGLDGGDCNADDNHTT